MVIWDPIRRGNHIPFTINSENSHFTPLKYIQQNGPQCGFAALCMVASSAGVDLNVDDLVKGAKVRNLTNHGEMFSAEELTNFAQTILHGQFDIDLKSYSIKGKCYEIKNYLQRNNLILIPYDCDFNHEPCLKNGVAAHWAVLCGFIDGGRENDFFVLACHGKSRYISAWKFNDLQSSNDNLLKVDEKHLLKNYVIPAGGLSDGLASKWILFIKK